VLVEQVDRVGAEALEQAVDARADRLGAAVEAVRRAGRELPPELRRDHDLLADWLERFADEQFVRERPVHLRGIEERHAALDRVADQRDHLVAVGQRWVAAAHGHAAEPEGGDLQVALSEGAAQHRFSLSCVVAAVMSFVRRL
jgi:hypothetical protein